MPDETTERELSYEVGGDRRRPPEAASFKLRGTIGARRELYVDDDVQLLVMDADGQIILSSYAKVTGVAFKKHRPNNGVPWVERIHTVTLGLQAGDGS
jgi:hypothetical protein